MYGLVGSCLKTRRCLKVDARSGLVGECDSWQGDTAGQTQSLVGIW